MTFLEVWFWVMCGLFALMIVLGLAIQLMELAIQLMELDDSLKRGLEKLWQKRDRGR
jgi:hypothetical protein